MGVHARKMKRHVGPDGRVDQIQRRGPLARQIAALALFALTGVSVAARAQGPLPVPAPGSAPTQASAPAQPQVFKWVDADGRTHYSERKPTEPGTRAAEIKPPPPPPDNPAPRKESPAATASSSTTTAAMTASAPATDAAAGLRTSRIYALSEGLDPNTDAYRCALAKDVLSGAVRRSAMRPTDDHDRNVARNDIKLFCK